MITFTNPGEIDPRLITTLGVNVKESDNPVGFFGTGLKYAIAVLLREAQQLTIYSGLRKFTFTLEPDEIRGKTFQFIIMHEGSEATRLGFTTELGKNWSLENAYRELYCNAMDEGGQVLDVKFVQPAPGHTTIIVRGEAFDDTHTNRHSFILPPERKPLASSEGIACYSGRTNTIFYRGIAAGRTNKPLALTYNITSSKTLTEDRTFKYQFFAEAEIARFLTQYFTNEDRLYQIITTDCAERDLNLVMDAWSPHFLAAVRRAIHDCPMSVPGAIQKAYYAQNVNSGHDYTPFELPPALATMLKEAKDTLTAAGFWVDKYPIIPVESLGENVLGLARQGKIFLSRETFEREIVGKTLLEEYIHLRHGVEDESRAMQEVMLSLIWKFIQPKTEN